MNGTVNATQAVNGRIGLLLDAGAPFSPGTRQVLTLRFRVLAEAALGATPLIFDDSVLPRSISNQEAQPLIAHYENGKVTIAERTDTTKEKISSSRRVPILSQRTFFTESLIRSSALFGP